VGEARRAYEKVWRKIAASTTCERAIAARLAV